jgi:Fuc2NAc and GlcNAc transferase
LAIVAAALGGVVYLAGSAQLPPNLASAMAGGLAVAAVGFWDDHGHVGAGWRLAVQIGAAFWALYWFDGAESFTVGGERLSLSWLGTVLGGFFIVWMVNLFNFMDGIDGIAATEVVTVAASAALLSCFEGSGSTGSGAGLATLAAAAGGFLVWNWPPAKIFMGDVGSGFVGYSLAVFALHSAVTSGLSLAVWLILSAVFWIDASLTLVVRIVSGARWYEAHRSHAYQHAARLRADHAPVTAGVLAINLIWLLPWAAAAALWPRWELSFLVLACLPVAVAALRLGSGRA